MDDKITFKQTIKSFDVPLVMEMDEPISDIEKAKKIAEDIGYPVMIKASASGGGKGMRIVENRDEFERSSRLLSFGRSSEACLDKVERSEAQVGILTREISIDTIKEVCCSGATLSQKSTYFYPKAICGFLFGSIHADEFDSDFDSLLQ